MSNTNSFHDPYNKIIKCLLEAVVERVVLLYSSSLQRELSCFKQRHKLDRSCFLPLLLKRFFFCLFLTQNIFIKENMHKNTAGLYLKTISSLTATKNKQLHRCTHTFIYTHTQDVVPKTTKTLSNVTFDL